MKRGIHPLIAVAGAGIGLYFTIRHGEALIATILRNLR